MRVLHITPLSVAIGHSWLMRRHAIWIILVSFLLSGCRLGAVETEAGDPVVLTGVRRRPLRHRLRNPIQTPPRRD